MGVSMSLPPNPSRLLALLLAPAVALLALAAQAQQDPIAQPAEAARLATRSLLLDVAAAGGRLVAVGERGHVLLSEDGGTTWRQAAEVPTRALLTAVCFFDSSRGVAVGHDEVIIATRDAGSTWQRVHYAPEAQRPLLDVWCGQDGRAIAIGAYGAYLASEDRGRTWQQRRFEAVRAVLQDGRGGDADSPEEFEDYDLGGGYHLNRITAASADRLYIAAEAGHLYRSDDRGATWIELPSPYEGSFFGILPLARDALLAYGLRGNLFRSDDAGMSWREITTGTVAMLNDAVRLADGAIVIVGLAGTVLVSRDGGETFTPQQQDDRKGLSAAVAVSRDTLVTVGEEGVKLIPATRRAGHAET